MKALKKYLPWIFGLLAALLYASVILINKRLHGISAYDKTIMQLGLAALLLLPYTLLTGEFSMSMDVPSAVMMILVGVVHTGFAYWLYFGSISGLRAQTVALLSYIDPVASVILAVWLLPGSVLTTAASVRVKERKSSCNAEREFFNSFACSNT